MDKHSYVPYVWSVFLTMIYPVWCSSNEINQFVKPGLIPICTSDIKNMEVPDKSLGLVNVLVMKAAKKYTAYSLPQARFLLTDPHFNSSRKTILYSHGFLQNATLYPSFLVTDSYLYLNNTNVLMLNSFPLMSINYFTSVTAVRKIGKTLGNQLFAMTKMGFNIETLQIIGHSLGAHIMGFAGKQFKKRSGKKLPSIIGLDPAGPCYIGVSPEKTLNKNDAEFVQIIHTNGGFLGIMMPIGHVNFYSNGGRVQPTKFPIIPNIISSHERSVELWCSSILNDNKFIGKKCANILQVDSRKCCENGSLPGILGPKANPNVKGIFYLSTSSKPPYYIE